MHNKIFPIPFKCPCEFIRRFNLHRLLIGNRQLLYHKVPASLWWHLNRWVCRLSHSHAEMFLHCGWLIDCANEMGEMHK